MRLLCVYRIIKCVTTVELLVKNVQYVNHKRYSARITHAYFIKFGFSSYAQKKKKHDYKKHKHIGTIKF